MLNIHEVKIDQDILEKARLPIERMLNLKSKQYANFMEKLGLEHPRKGC